MPDSPVGENVRSAVKRGDIDGASFRFVIGEESWTDNVRTIERVAALHDITVATLPAYPDTSIELRTKPDNKEKTMEDTREDKQEDKQEDAAERTSTSAGSLRVADVNAGKPENRTLHGAFKRAGWAPGKRAEIAWDDFAGASESRALTWTGSVDNVSMYHDAASPFGADQRYAWPAFPQVPVDSGVTSVQVLTQTARTLPSAATVVRAIDAVTNKPEAASTITVVATAMKQLAAVQTGVPNVMLEQDRIESVIGVDLRLSINEGLDKLILDAIAASGFQAPGTDPLLVSIRKG